MVRAARRRSRLDIPVAHRLPSNGGAAGDPDLRKGEVDVVATFILHLYELAMERGDGRSVTAGWRALGDFIRAQGPCGEHLAQYRRHPLGMPA